MYMYIDVATYLSYLKDPWYFVLSKVVNPYIVCECWILLANQVCECSILLANQVCDCWILLANQVFECSILFANQS